MSEATSTPQSRTTQAASSIPASESNRAHAFNSDYPFQPQRFAVRPGIEMSYLDEGPRDGEIVVMLHGNPSWSFYWRNAVLGLRDRYRCIVPDHVGMGLSDKPADAQYRYTLQSRIDDLTALMDHLKIQGPVTLAVHDWGGLIGLGWALKHAERIHRLVITNTAAFPLPIDKRLPWQLKFCRDSRLAAFLIRKYNAFAAGAARDGVVTPMSPRIRAAFLAPYDTWANRIATLRFVQDIPLSDRDPAWPLVSEVGRRLSEFATRPTFIGWGLRDFVFDADILEEFTRALPQAEVHAFEDAGHYVLEDKHAVIVPAIRRFLDWNSLDTW